MKTPRSTFKEDDIVRKHLPDLKPFEEVYKAIHRRPELSTLETRTAAIAAKHLRSLSDFTVHEKIGGHGVVGVLRNGDGPTILLRADMDALPILEKTNLSYASTHRMVDIDGIEKPVMHACGHDIHVTSLMVASTLLHSAQSHWSGTLISLFQPAEERGHGALRMIKDGLYTKHYSPLPSVVLGQHCSADKAGHLGLCPGPFLAGRRQYTVKLFGRQTHATMPHRGVDPVLLAAYILVRLQSIVSRETDPMKMAVITCGHMAAGSASNVIPSSAEMSIDIRAHKPAILDHITEAMHRIINAECEASAVPQPAEIKLVSYTRPLTNDPATISHLQKSFKAYFGNERANTIPPATASDDFQELVPEGARLAYWNLGVTDPETWDGAEREGRLDQLKGPHSDGFAPALGLTLKTGTEALSRAALTFLKLK